MLVEGEPPLLFSSEFPSASSKESAVGDTNSKYEIAGVDIEAGDTFSAIVGKACRATYDNNRFVEVRDLSQGNFRGPRPFWLKGIVNAGLEPAPDGVGTKVSIYDALLMHRYAAHDVLAMTCTDVTRFGMLPAVFCNVLDVHHLGKEGSESFGLFVEMLDELVRLTRKLGVVALKGETAELGTCVGSRNPNPNAPFNWAGFTLGIVLEDRLILGDRVRVGDKVIALRENGFRSNGISLVQACFAQHYGPEFYSLPAGREDLLAAAAPSVLYDPLLTTANGWHTTNLDRLIDVRLIAHLTGGGMGKFQELLAPTGLSASLDDLFEPPSIMRKCAEWGEVSDEECYTAWHGGQGALVVVAPDEERAFLKMAEQFGIAAKTCGEIVASSETQVHVTSKYTGKALTF